MFFFKKGVNDPANKPQCMLHKYAPSWQQIYTNQTQNGHEQIKFKWKSPDLSQTGPHSDDKISEMHANGIQTTISYFKKIKPKKKAYTTYGLWSQYN